MSGISMRVGFVGYGYWGPNLARSFAQTQGCTVAALCDEDCERLSLATSCYPAARLTTSYDELLCDRSIDAVVIATPARLHFEIAMAALQRGKHVLVEKPMTRSVDEASRLADEGRRRNLALLVNHTFLFTPAVRKLQEMIATGILGDLRYFDSIRANRGLFREDVNVFWDVAVHDIAILHFILKEKPVALSAVGVKDVQGNPESIGYLTLFFDSGMIAHITASWLSPRKIRQITIGGSECIVCYDDMEPNEKVKLYDRRVASDVIPEPRHRLGAGSRRGDVWIPNIENTEALQSLAQHFRDCVQGTTLPLCDGDSGRRVIELLNAVDRSVAAGGSRVRIQC
jgi:predicted dehydrogenase